MDGLSCLIDRSRTQCTADGHEVRQSAADRDPSHPTGHTSCPIRLSCAAALPSFAALVVGYSHVFACCPSSEEGPIRRPEERARMTENDESLLIHMGGLGDICLSESAFLTISLHCGGPSGQWAARGCSSFSTPISPGSIR